MLSPHELSTLLLIQRSPHLVEAAGFHTVRLRQEALIEMTRLPSGHALPSLTPKGRDMLLRLGALRGQAPYDHDETR
ncbi:hypothetical protein [Caballeronia sp. LZ032]|uniref:hypothetical protein n=1 Tax=Caballeronia sp. LZ032 TaxID=3038565 RepID=UPI002854EC5C|nr:hypothetical protein [Caballeronia sp. LZ032]MDR5883361.1 hypothetical protein [Caballeronia sp. LZ032]